MADRSIVVRLRAEITDLKSKMAEASKSTEDFGKRTQNAISKNEQHINTLANGAGLLGLAMVAAAGTAVKAFADFDESMSAVQAATHESAENMGTLRDAALEAGARTKYSATEAAGAIEELAKAGISTADILGGALDGALDLAAAGGLDVAEAAGIAAVALKQFKLNGEDVTHVADLLAAGASKAMGDVTDLGSALRQVGQVANSSGLTIEETTAGLSAFASAGLLGSDAGTSFKAMLQRLTPQSAEAQRKFDELGISAYDAQGEFVGLSAFAGDLRESMMDLTPEARNAALGVMFGSDAVRAATVLYDEGAEGIEGWTEAVDEAGFAADTAAIRMDNLKGDFEQLGGSVETALIGLGESADGPLREVVQGATDLVNALAGAPDVIQGVTLGLVGGGGLVLLGLAGLGKMVVGISETKRAMEALGVSAKTAGKAVGVAAGALTVATVAVSAWVAESARAKAMSEALADTLGEQAEVTDDTRNAIRDMLSETRSISFMNFDAAYTEAEKMGISFDVLTEYVLGSKDAIDQVNAAGDEFVAGSSPWENVIQSRQGAVSNLTYTLDTMASSLSEAERAELQKIAADEAAGVASEDLTTEVDETTEAFEDQVTAIAAAIEAMETASGVVKSQMEAESDLQAAIDDATAAIEANGATLDITTEKGRANQDALFAIRDAGYDVVSSMEANGATQEQLQAQMQATRDEFVRVATEMGVSADEANRLADELGLIPAEIKPEVKVTVTWDQSAFDKAYSDWANRSRNIVVGVTTKSGPSVAVATGGYITGPGTGTSDSIPARLSNGEYVIKADSVSKYGKDFFDGLNAQRFATGGLVGAASSAPAAAFPDSVTLDRASVMAMARAVAGIRIEMDGRNVARSVDEQIGRAVR